jgi:hypothetical protein
LWGHESVLLELIKSHVREIIDSLDPRVFTLVVGSDFLEGFGEDLESVFRLFSVERVELRVDFSGSGFMEGTGTVQEVSVLDVEVSVGETKGNESEDK